MSDFSEVSCKFCQISINFYHFIDLEELNLIFKLSNFPGLRDAKMPLREYGKTQVFLLPFKPGTFWKKKLGKPPWTVLFQLFTAYLSSKHDMNDNTLLLCKLFLGSNFKWKRDQKIALFLQMTNHTSFNFYPLNLNQSKKMRNHPRNQLKAQKAQTACRKNCLFFAMVYPKMLGSFCFGERTDKVFAREDHFWNIGYIWNGYLKWRMVLFRLDVIINGFLIVGSCPGRYKIFQTTLIILLNAFFLWKWGVNNDRSRSFATSVKANI